MPAIFDAANRHRTALEEGERRASRAMIEAYGQAWLRLQVQLKNVTDLISSRRASGEAVNPAWLAREQHVRIMIDETAREISRVSDFAGTLITAEQRTAVFLAEQHAHELFRLGRGARPDVFARVDTQSLTNLVGFLGDGSPLSRLLSTFGPEAAQGARDALTTGVATGQSARQIAAGVRRATGTSLARALTISTTETARAYRESAHLAALENRELLSGWVWHCRLGTRTCMSCIAKSGTVHRLTERLHEHPRGRCIAVPIPRDPETEFPEQQTGLEWFEAQNEERQFQMLGAAKFGAWKAGAIDLPDLVGTHHSRAWGDHHFERSLADILGTDAKQFYGRAP